MSTLNIPSFFQWGDKGVAYSTPEEMAAFLDEFPEATGDYLEGTFALIRSTVAIEQG